MKLTAFLMIIAILQANANVFAQRVSYVGKEAPMKKVLNQVESQTGYFFFYSSKEVLKIIDSSKVTVNATGMPLQQFLSEMLKDKPIAYDIEDNTISLSARPISQPVAEQQEKRVNVTGQVVDTDGKPVPGATIAVRNTTLGASADAMGRFTLNNIPADARLIVSAIGYMPVGVRLLNNNVMTDAVKLPTGMGQPIGNDNAPKSSFGIGENGAIIFKLARQATSMEGVVVTGMFQRSSSSYTGAAKTISGAELKKVSSNNVFAAVSALDPAFRIVPNNIAGGNINRLPDIQMRGSNSFPNLSGELSANPNAPLFILDGFEVSLQRIVDLDMNLISSITLLKDASATAIYGSRGANGVMVVTTVTPQAGRLQVTFNNDFRFTTPDLSVYHLLNAREKMDFEKRAGVYTDANPNVQYRLDYLYNERLKAVESGVNTNWLTLPVQNGYSNRSSLYLQGGDQSIRYGIQMSADLQSGVMKGQDRKNYSGQFDLTYMVKKFQFKNSLRVFQNKANESPYGNFSDYVTMNPYWAPYNPDGSPKQLLENISIHPYIYKQTNPVFDVSLHSIDQTQYFGLSNNFQMKYNILPSFYLETNFSLNKQTGSSDQFFSAQDSRFDEITDLNRKGSYTVRNDNSFGYESLTTANLNIVKGPHQLFSTLGFNAASTTNNYYSVVTEGFPFDKLDNLLFAAQYQQNGRPSGDESTVRRIGLVFSGNYSYDNRFLADISVRRDGSSQFGTDKRFGTFWAAGVGWNIHNEKFFRQNAAINRLKLRASYGSTGSLNIPAYSAQSRYTFGVNTSYYGDLGAILISPGNKALSWQNVYKLNIGLDAVLLRERLDLRLDLYREDTRNTLTQITLAPSTGFSSYSENLGNIQNKGLEFNVRLKLIENKAQGILWSVNVNGFTNQNVLKKLSNRLKASNDKLNNENEDQTAPNVLFEEGQSINTIYVVRSLGVDPATGSEVYLAKDGSKTYVWKAADKIAYGINQPKWNGNFGTNLLYKGIEIGMIFNYQYGGQLYNQTLIDRVESVNPRYNVDRRAYDLGWSKPGDKSPYTRIGLSTPATKLTSRFVQDDNNLIASSISAGYNFYRNAWLKRTGLRSLQITAISNDLFRISSIDIERGTSNPFARTYSLSVRAGF
jgi:TonB-linked SusC/RagA family outer membrane protein